MQYFILLALAGIILCGVSIPLLHTFVFISFSPSLQPVDNCNHGIISLNLQANTVCFFSEGFSHLYLLFFLLFFSPRPSLFSFYFTCHPSLSLSLPFFFSLLSCSFSIPMAAPSVKKKIRIITLIFYRFAKKPKVTWVFFLIKTEMRLVQHVQFNSILEISHAVGFITTRFPMCLLTGLLGAQDFWNINIFASLMKIHLISE